MKNLSENNIKIDEISIDVVERELEFVGLKDNRGDRGLTGGIVHQGIIRVVTSTGIEGNSMIGQHRGNSTDKIKEILKTFKPILINSKERDWKSIWKQLFELVKSQNNNKNLYSECLASIDIAIWDIIGKTNKSPIHEILGQIRNSIPVYGTYQPRYENHKGYLEEALEIKSKKFKAYKIPPFKT